MSRDKEESHGILFSTPSRDSGGLRSFPVNVHGSTLLRGYCYSIIPVLSVVLPDVSPKQSPCLLSIYAYLEHLHRKADMAKNTGTAAKRRSRAKPKAQAKPANENNTNPPAPSSNLPQDNQNQPAVPVDASKENIAPPIPGDEPKKPRGETSAPVKKAEGPEPKAQPATGLGFLSQVTPGKVEGSETKDKPAVGQLSLSPATPAKADGSGLKAQPATGLSFLAPVTRAKAGDSDPKSQPATGQGFLAPTTPARESNSSSPTKPKRSRSSRKKKPITTTALTGGQNGSVTQGNKMGTERKDVCASCMPAVIILGNVAISCYAPLLRSFLALDMFVVLKCLVFS